MFIKLEIENLRSNGTIENQIVFGDPREKSAAGQIAGK